MGRLRVTSFPRAMLIMAAAFGLWRARLISNAFFAAGVAAVVLVLLGGTTWLSGGFWAADGVYSRFVSPAIGLVWGMVLSGVLLTRVLLHVLDGEADVATVRHQALLLARRKNASNSTAGL